MRIQCRRTVIPSLLASVSILPTIFAQSAGPVLPGATVTIPYSELQALWAAAQQAENSALTTPQLPVDALLRSASYAVEIREGSAAVRAEFQASNLSRDWQFVPLVGGGVRIGAIAPEAAQIVRRDGVFGVLLAPEEQIAVALDLEAGDPGSGIGFTPAPATVGKLSIAGVPADRSVAIDGAFAAGDPAAHGYSLAPEGGALTIKLVAKTAAPQAPRELAPSEWDISGEVVVGFADGSVEFEAKLHLHAAAGDGRTARLILPAGARVKSPSGDDLDEWKPARGDGGRPQLDVGWGTPEILDRELVVAWQIGRGALDAELELVPVGVEPAAAAAEPNFLFAVRAVPGLELLTPDGTDPGAPQQLPGWSATRLGSAEYLTVSANAGPVAMRTRWLPRVETAEAIVASATFTQNLVEQGAILTNAQFTIDHPAPTRFIVDLPAGGEVLTCKVAGQAVRPVRRAEGQLEFALPAPVDGAPTVVEFCYAGQLDPLDPVSGDIDLALPRTDLFIHQLDWKIEIPERYETTAAEGSVTIATSDGAGANHLHLVKQLCRGEIPAVALYYQRTR